MSIHDEIKVVTPIRYDLEDLVNELPDGNIITVGANVFFHVEVLFQPNFMVKESVKSTTLLSRATSSAAFTPAKMCTPCRVVKRHHHVPRDC